MFAIIHLLATFIADLFKPPPRLEVENLFLRHQLNVALRRGPQRVRLRAGFCTVEFHLRMSGSTSIMISATSLRRTAKTPRNLPLLQGGVLSVPRVHEGPQPLEPPVHGRGVPPASALTVGPCVLTF